MRGFVFIEMLIALAIAAILAALVYEAAVAETFTLRKDQWKCLATTTSTRVVFDTVNNVTTSRTVTDVSCAVFRRNDYE